MINEDKIITFLGFLFCGGVGVLGSVGGTASTVCIGASIGVVSLTDATAAVFFSKAHLGHSPFSVK